MIPEESPGLPDRPAITLAYPAPDFDTAGVSTTTDIVRPARFVPIVSRRPNRGRNQIESVPTVLVDQSALFRVGLRHILIGSRFRVTAECSSIHDVAPDAFGGVSTVAVIGLDREAVAVLRYIRELKAKHPELRIIALGDRIQAEQPEQLVAAIEAGADGYLLRDEVEPRTVLKSLEMILADGVVVPQGFTKLIRMVAPQQDISLANVPAPKSAGIGTPVEASRPSVCLIDPEAAVPVNLELARLSERERLILTYLTAGSSNKQIARTLDVAEATVKAHVKSLLRKLRVNNRTQAAMWAISRATPGEQVQSED